MQFFQRHTRPDYLIMSLCIHAHNNRAAGLQITHDTDDEEDLQSVHVVSRAEMAKIMSEQDVILSY